MSFLSHTGDKEDQEQERLLEIRMRLKREMERAVQAVKPKDKIALAKEWEEKYTDSQYEELLRLARHKKSPCQDSGMGPVRFRQNQTQEIVDRN